MDNPQVQQFLAQIVVLGGVASSILTEVLKSNLIPLDFQKAPRWTVLLVSTGVSVLAVWLSPVSANLVSVLDWLTVIALTAGAAVFTYRNVLKDWANKYRTPQV